MPLHECLCTTVCESVSKCRRLPPSPEYARITPKDNAQTTACLPRRYPSSVRRVSANRPTNSRYLSINPSAIRRQIPANRRYSSVKCRHIVGFHRTIVSSESTPSRPESKASATALSSARHGAIAPEGCSLWLPLRRASTAYSRHWSTPLGWVLLSLGATSLESFREGHLRALPERAKRMNALVCVIWLRNRSRTTLRSMSYQSVSVFSSLTNRAKNGILLYNHS
jgi:hypothetical protein